MKRFSFVLLALVAVAAWGCGNTDSGGEKTADEGSGEGSGQVSQVTPVSVDLCGGCGHEKGADNCCAEDADKCDGCGLAKGSRLCCVEMDDALKGKDICACGYAKGSDDCCKEGAEKCTKCGMIEGSTFCCKIKKKDS